MARWKGVESDAFRRTTGGLGATRHEGSVFGTGMKKGGTPKAMEVRQEPQGHGAYPQASAEAARKSCGGSPFRESHGGIPHGGVSNPTNPMGGAERYAARTRRTPG